jgi:hypothetical protein
MPKFSADSAHISFSQNPAILYKQILNSICNEYYLFYDWCKSLNGTGILVRILVVNDEGAE